MANWGDEEPAPLKLPCVSCGRATLVRNQKGLCSNCNNQFLEEYDAYLHDQPEPDPRTMYQGHTQP